MTDFLDGPRGHSRRAFLGVAGLTGAALTGWSPTFQVPAEAASLPRPAGFPSTVALRQQAYRNWSGQIAFDRVWTAIPAGPDDVVALANWARERGYRLRAKGKQHNWSPILMPAGADVSKVVLVDTTEHLISMSVAPGTPATVTAQAGVTIDALLYRLEQAGYGLLASTAAGNLTIGGVLAVGGHGTGVPAQGEHRPAGGSYGSLANLVLSLTAVVWDQSTGIYTTKTFRRSDPDIGAFLVHLGRAFVTEVTLQIVVNQRVRCRNRTDVPVTELFGRPGSGPSTVESFLASSGRIEVLWFPFTGTSWLKVWEVSPAKPRTSTQITTPYPYLFTNVMSQSASDLVKTVNLAAVAATPALMASEMSVTTLGLAATGTSDIWGWSKNSLLYAMPSTLRIVQASWAVLTSRANVQRVVHEFFRKFHRLMTSYRSNGQFPVNAPLEIRITGLDRPDEVALAGAVPPLLSAAAPRPDHPEWDTCIWLSPSALPGTPASADFFTALETWVWQNYCGDYATVRPEWSKAWAHSPAGAWTDKVTIGTAIPRAFRDGPHDKSSWDTAVETLHRYDPHQVFTNPFLQALLR